MKDPLSLHPPSSLLLCVCHTVVPVASLLRRPKEIRRARTDPLNGYFEVKRTLTYVFKVYFEVTLQVADTGVGLTCFDNILYRGKVAGGWNNVVADELKASSSAVNDEGTSRRPRAGEDDHPRRQLPRVPKK